MTATLPATVRGAAPRGRLASLLAATRPKQWVKNLVVLAAPGAAGVLGRPLEAARTAVALVAFVLVSAGCYLVNDTIDAAADRLHPHKRHRPVASGAVRRRSALGAAVLLVAAGLALGGVATGWQLLAVLATYVVITLSYSVGLKRIAVVELAAVASGFVLRAVAGAAATHVPVSQWFLIVTSFGSLFLVIGKRYAEVCTLGEGAAGHRQVLAEYTAPFLRQIRDISAGVTILAYCLWAFDRAAAAHGGRLLDELSIVPVTLGLFRYALLIERGQGGAPEDVLFGDRTILVLAVLWAALFGAAVALGVGRA